MQEIQVQSLGWEVSLEKRMTTNSVFLSGQLHGQKSLKGYSPSGCKKSDMTTLLDSIKYTSVILKSAECPGEYIHQF